MLEKVNFPLTKAQISDFILEKEYTFTPLKAITLIIREICQVQVRFRCQENFLMKNMLQRIFLTEQVHLLLKTLNLKETEA